MKVRELYGKLVLIIIGVHRQNYFSFCMLNTVQIFELPNSTLTYGLPTFQSPCVCEEVRETVLETVFGVGSVSAKCAYGPCMHGWRDTASNPNLT